MLVRRQIFLCHWRKISSTMPVLFLEQRYEYWPESDIWSGNNCTISADLNINGNLSPTANLLHICWMDWDTCNLVECDHPSDLWNIHLPNISSLPACSSSARVISSLPSVSSWPNFIITYLCIRCPSNHAQFASMNSFSWILLIELISFVMFALAAPFIGSVMCALFGRSLYMQYGLFSIMTALEYAVLLYLLYINLNLACSFSRLEEIKCCLTWIPKQVTVLTIW